MFKTLTRRASSALKRPSADDGAARRIINAFNTTTTQPHRYQNTDAVTAIGYADPLPDPKTAASLRLIDYPRNEIEVICEHCGKSSQFRTHRLIAEYGTTEKVADVLAIKAQSCPQLDAAKCCRLVLKAEGL